jgi:hypothetical protein
LLVSFLRFHHQWQEFHQFLLSLFVHYKLSQVEEHQFLLSLFVHYKLSQVEEHQFLLSSFVHYKLSQVEEHQFLLSLFVHYKLSHNIVNSFHQCLQIQNLSIICLHGIYLSCSLANIFLTPNMNKRDTPTQLSLAW